MSTMRDQIYGKEQSAVGRFLEYKGGLALDSIDSYDAEGGYFEYVESKVRMSRLDGLIYERFPEGSGRHLAAGVEIKWRRFDLPTLMTQHNGEMLMPADKLLAGQALAYAFGVPTLLLYLLDDYLLAQKVVAGNGDKVNVAREVYEQSNRTIEGGTIQRKNCYIKVEGAETIPLGL
jgi:hypothetical protein